MSKPYYEKPLKPQPADVPCKGTHGDEASDLAYASPGDDPTVAGTQRRGAPHLSEPPTESQPHMASKESQNQQATSSKSRADSGTP